MLLSVHDPGKCNKRIYPHATIFPSWNRHHCIFPKTNFFEAERGHFQDVPIVIVQRLDSNRPTDHDIPHYYIDYIFIFQMFKKNFSNTNSKRVTKMAFVRIRQFQKIFKFDELTNPKTSTFTRFLDFSSFQLLELSSGQDR